MPPSSHPRRTPAPRSLRGRWPAVVFATLALALIAGMVLWITYETSPGVRFRVQAAWAQVMDQVAPRPQLLPTVAVAAAPPTFAPTPTASPTPAVTRPSGLTPALPTPAGPTETPSPVPPTPTPFPTPPRRVVLTGIKHEYQLFNNCGPASLAMNLSFWGWTGTQKDAAKVLKPVQDDKNVSPREQYEYLLTQGYDAYIRVNGTVDDLRRFLAAGYPVLVEKGFTCQPGERCTGWFGHYSVFSGYDDGQQWFVTQDSFLGPNYKLSYDEVLKNWRAFNFLYLVIFPAGAERDAQVQALLGPADDVDANYRAALARAQAETSSLSGQDAAFAWFNVGTNLVYLKDYGGAAAAYDQARQVGLPYRMMWYQFGPYLAYYYMARYQDVVDLATFAIDGVTPGVVPGLEESYYWRGQAEEMLGQRDLAVADYRTALLRHPGYSRAVEALQALGETP